MKRYWELLKVNLHLIWLAFLMMLFAIGVVLFVAGLVLAIFLPALLGLYIILQMI